jgi:HK97 family phage portal protein
MGFWKRILGMEAKGDYTSLDLFRDIYGRGRESHAGVVVNVQTALEVATVLACCRVIAEGVSQIPFKVYRETDKGSSPARDHPLYPVLYRRPNSWQTSFEFREMLMFHTILCGNAYVFVNRVGIGREIKELIPIEPGRVTVKQNRDYSLEYKVTAETGEAKVFGQDAIWHLRGPSWNSWMGLEATKLARNAIGLAVSLEQGQSEFQKNGAKNSGVLSVDGKLNKEQYELLATWLDRHMIGGDRSHKPFIADQGAKWLSNVMTGVDQQLLETRKHQIEEMCREFRVMPIMVGQSDKAATYASAEQMFLAHVVHTLSPWYQRIEQSADVNLLSEAELDEGYYTKFIPNALMKGAAKDRAEFYSKALGSGGGKGWMTQNDVRALEELDRSDDPEADKLPQQITKQPTTNPPSDPASEE